MYIVFSTLLSGVKLKDGFAKAQKVSIVKNTRNIKQRFGSVEKDYTVLELSVCEGRKHFVKNILASVGFPVHKLCRISFGPYKLDNLPLGTIKEVKFE